MFCSNLNLVNLDKYLKFLRIEFMGYQRKYELGSWELSSKKKKNYFLLF